MTWNSLKNIFEIIILIYFLLLNFTYFILLFTSYFVSRRQILLTSSQKNIQDLLKPSFIPGITLLVPAYNEEKTLIKNIYSLLMLQYTKVEIIIINDGSTDQTMESLIKEFKLKPVEMPHKITLKTEEIRKIYKSENKSQLIVVDKENGGKSDALNCGINIAHYKYFCCVDADVILTPNALINLVRPFLENPTETLATGGIIRVANNCINEDGTINKNKLPKKILPSLQMVEYIRSFFFGRLGFSVINGLLIVSGAFSMFSTEMVRRVGGVFKIIYHRRYGINYGHSFFCPI